MADEVAFARDGRTYRVRGLAAKARSVSSGSSELDGILADRISAARSALADWRGRHSQVFGEEVNGVLGRIAGLRIALWQAGNLLASFPESSGASWGSVRYQDEIYMGARVDVPVEPGVASAVTSMLRAYVTTSSGQDERFATLAGLVNLEGVTAEVTYQRPLNHAERREALDAGESPASLAGVTVDQTEPVDPSTLITLPRPQDQVRALVAASSSLNQYTAAVAAAFDNADQPMLAALAAGAGVLDARLAWLQADPRRWAQLTPQDQEVLIAAMPDAIGAMDGLPTVVRDQANRRVLQRTKQELRARLAQLQSGSAAGGRTGEIEAIMGKLRGIEAIEQRLGRMWPGRQQAYLLGFSADGNGRAIVAIGNPDYARDVATYIPGTFSRLARVDGDIERADRMAYDANTLDPQNPTSVIMWMDYDAPQSLPAAARGSYATNGAPTLQHFQAGLDIAHTGGGAHKTVLGHSYGTVVIGHATRGGGHLDTDDAVFVASPGVGVDNVSELGVDSSHVFATTAAHDGIRVTRFIHGRQPVNPDFGARVFESAPGSRNPVKAHSQYWDDRNPARGNMAAIITGNYDLVMPPTAPPTPSPTPSPTPGPSATAPR